MLGKSMTCCQRGTLTQASSDGASEGSEVTLQELAGPDILQSERVWTPLAG